MKDAFGNQVKIGNFYGTYSAANGIVKFSIGKVIGFLPNERYVKFEKLHTGTGVYYHPIELDKKTGSNIVNIYGNRLIPIDLEADLNWD